MSTWSGAGAVGAFLVVVLAVCRVALIMTGHDDDAVMTAAFSTLVAAEVGVLATMHVISSRSG